MGILLARLGPLVVCPAWSLAAVPVGQPYSKRRNRTTSGTHERFGTLAPGEDGLFQVGDAGYPAVDDQLGELVQDRGRGGVDVVAD